MTDERARAEAGGPLWLVTGGARSGKSAFAEALVRDVGEEATYIATMRAPGGGTPQDETPADPELAERIARHRAERPPRWQTVEAPLALAGAVRAAPAGRPVLVDCLSLWVTNHLLRADPDGPAAVAVLEAQLLREIDELAEARRARRAPLVVVTNEVGDGVVPEAPLGRAFRDLLGRVNQRASLAADRAWLLVAGRPLELPPPRR